MFTALASLMTNRAVRSDVAMTGEVSLRGLVLPIGGVKEKVLAALRAGITTVMLPKRNQRDLEDIPEDARKQLDVRLARNGRGRSGDGDHARCVTRSLVSRPRLKRPDAARRGESTQAGPAGLRYRPASPGDDRSRLRSRAADRPPGPSR